MLRVIYMIEVFNYDGELIDRRFARNMKTAEKIAKQYGDLADIRCLNKNEWSMINPEWVEG